MIRGNALLVLDLLLHVVDRVGRLHLQSDGLAGQGLDEDLYTTSQSQHQVQGGLLLNVVVGQSAAVIELLAGEDESLLIRGKALLVLDLLLHVVDRVRRLHFQRHGRASHCLDEDLHTT